ncbi:MAG: hypothetical protein CMI32_02875 [Opitutales bacterium]|nr:hypothetical protein [Opitutales bacterium]
MRGGSHLLFRWFLTIFFLSLLAACSSPWAKKKESFPLLDPSVLGRPFEGPYPFAIGFPATAYYLTGPQQAKPPDGSFPKGVRVALILDAGSYSLVTSKSGITAYVSSDALHLVK